MDDRRITPLMGVVAVVLFVIALFVIESESTPDSDASGIEVAAYLDGALGTLAVALVLWGLGTIALLWFLDGVRERLSVFSDQYGRLAFFFGFGVALLMLASSPAGYRRRVRRATSSTASSRRAPRRRSAASATGSSSVPRSCSPGSSCSSGWRRSGSARCPSGSAGSRSLLAVLALIPPIGWAVVVWGFPLWILIVAVLMWRSAEPAAVEHA